MPRFAYSAYDPSGKIIHGELTSASELEALDSLAAKGLTPVQVSAGGSALPWYQREFSLSGKSGALKPAAIERFFNGFSALLSSSFPLVNALKYSAEQAQDPATRRALSRLGDSVENGASLQAAMAEIDPAFPPRLQTLVGVGESANTLAEVSARIATMLASQARMRRELRSALIYPAILLVMSALVLGLIVFYLVPTLEPVFRSAQAPLPLPLHLMSGFRQTVLNAWPLMLGLFAALLVLGFALRAPIQRGLAALATRLPVIGPFLRQRATLDICQSLSLMLGSGATLSQALTTAEQSSLNPAYTALLAQASERITSGGTLSQTLLGNPLIDQMTATLLQAGEEADRLPQVLDTATADLSDRTSRTLAQLIQMLTPVLTLLIGFSVGAVILSTIAAIMDLNDIVL